MDKFIDLINKHLLQYTETISDAEFREIIKYSLFPGGKRLRPLLLLSIIADLGISLDTAINQAIAIEMIHNYSLIHDDLPSMDDDDYRRGQLTVHKKYGEANAILAGDALLTDSFKYFVKGNIEAEIKLKIVSLAANNSGTSGMVYGQFLDINSSSKSLNLEEVKIIHSHKTKDLIHLAIRCASYIANLPEESVSKLDEIANYFGLAFQIKDDLDDYDESRSDLINNRATYPSTIGKDKSLKLLNDYKTKSLDICYNILGDKSFYKLIERIL